MLTKNTKRKSKHNNIYIKKPNKVTSWSNLSRDCLTWCNFEIIVTEKRSQMLLPFKMFRFTRQLQLQSFFDGYNHSTFIYI